MTTRGVGSLISFSTILLFGLALSAQTYTIFTAAAGGAALATPIPAVDAAIGLPQGVAVDPSGNIVFTGGNCVFKVDSHGTLTRVAGNSHAGFSGDGGAAINAQLNGQAGIAVDSSGNLYIADYFNSRIRKVNPS